MIIEDAIIQKLGKKDFGEAANKINEIAKKVIEKKEFARITRNQQKDLDECDGMDGMLLNNEYFDWKEFETRKNDMIRAFLRYFDIFQLQVIYLNL